MVEAFTNFVLQFREVVNLLVYHSEVKLDNVIKAVSELIKLWYFLVDKLLTGERYEKCH